MRKSFWRCLVLCGITGVAFGGPARPDRPVTIQRLEKLRSGVQATQPLVPGVARGWEADPRAESWITRCDKQSEANACWLAGAALYPQHAIESQTHIPLRVLRTGKWYLEKGCNLGSGEACADLADLYRFGRNGWRWEGQGNAPGEAYAPDLAALVRHDLKQASELFRKACEMVSAYGCYNWAEFLDRGIGVPPSHETARGLFRELCAAGLSLGCLRATQPQAPVYPFQLFSAMDSSCNEDADCWEECSQGAWGACDKTSLVFQRHLQATVDSRLQLEALQERGCLEGADWGCARFSPEVYPADLSKFGSRDDSTAQTLRQTLRRGCQAGSAMACRSQCAMEKSTDCPVPCEATGGHAGSANSTNAPRPRCKGETVAARMRECMVGNGSSCATPLYLLSGRPQTTAEENEAYSASTLVIKRLACNSGDPRECDRLADHFVTRRLDPQRARAYALAACGRSRSNLSTPYTQCAVVLNSLNPVERAMASEWYDWIFQGKEGAQNLSEDVIGALEEPCAGGNGRACLVLGNNAWNSSEHRRVEPEREKIIQYWQSQVEIDGKKREEALKECAELARTGATDPIQCISDAVKAFDLEERKLMTRLGDARSLKNIVAVESDPALRSKALGYYAAACRYGEAEGCERLEKRSRQAAVRYEIN